MMTTGRACCIMTIHILCGCSGLLEFECCEPTFSFLIYYACSCIGTLDNLWIPECQQHVTVYECAQVHQLPWSHYGDDWEGMLYQEKCIYICYTHAGLLEFQHSVWFLSPHSFSIYYTCISCSNLSTIWILERQKHVNVHVCLSVPAIIKPWWWQGGHVDNAYILRSSWFAEIWAVCAFLEPSLFWR